MANIQVLRPYIEPSLKDDFQLRIQHKDKLKANLDDMKCVEIPNFEEQFKPVFERNQLEDKKRQLQLKLSNEGMALYPDYLNMVALLKHLKYIDNDERGSYTYNRTCIFCINWFFLYKQYNTFRCAYSCPERTRCVANG